MRLAIENGQPLRAPVLNPIHCDLLMESSVVAKSFLDPHVREIHENIAVQISFFVQPAALYSYNAPNNPTTVTFGSLVGTIVPYKKKKINPVVILLYFREPIGMAILRSAHKDCNDRGQAVSGDPNGFHPVSSDFHASDPRKAVIISDLQLYGERTDSSFQRYKYSEWYGMDMFQGLSESHFGHGCTPDKVTKVLSK